MPKVEVDYDACVGCGTCQALCPDVFEIRDDGKSWVINPDAITNCNVDEVVNSCPVGAIKVEL